MQTKLSLLGVLLLVATSTGAAISPQSPDPRHLLYVAVPGIRDYSQYGGTGILVFDIDQQHRFVRRITVPSLGDDRHAEATKGICASAATGRLYISTPKSLICLELTTDKVLWQKTYDSGCDRMSISPDGQTIFAPTLEGKYWHVIEADRGREIAKITTGSGSHNTICAPNGRQVYLAGLHSPVLSVVNARTYKIESTVGPFAAPIRPFTVDGRGTRCYVCVDGLLGFEVGDLHTGKKLCRVEVEGFKTGPTLRHGCPSHGIGLTPDEKELWVTDAHNSRLHVFDNTVTPPKQIASIALRDQPGWVTFSIDGRFAYPSSGDVIDTKNRKVVTGLKDERGQDVQSEKLMEIDFADGKAVQAGDQFGIGRMQSTGQKATTGEEHLP